MLTPSTADTSAARRRCERGRPWRGAGAPPALRDPRQRHGPPARPRRAAPPPHAPLPITAPRPEPRAAGFESGPLHAPLRRRGGTARRGRGPGGAAGSGGRSAAPGAPRGRAAGSPRGRAPRPGGGSGGRADRPGASPPPPDAVGGARAPASPIVYKPTPAGRAPASTAAAGAARAGGGAGPGPAARAAMPCRPGERFLLLERSVAVGPAGSKEVDALVAKLGEVLQLSAQRAPPPRGPKHQPGPGSARDRAAPYSPRCCPPAPPPALPPAAPRPEQQRVAKQLCGRGWLRSAARRRKQQRRPPPGPPDPHEEDPHRLLQQLILSGNLIKEAVRRLQLAAAAVGSGGGDGEAAAAAPQ